MVLGALEYFALVNHTIFLMFSLCKIIDIIPKDTCGCKMGEVWLEMYLHFRNDILCHVKEPILIKQSVLKIF